MLDHDAIRNWSWWDSPEWKAYTEAYGSAAGRPVHGQSYVVDLSGDPRKWLSKGHKAAVKQQMATQHIRTSTNVEPFHRAHVLAAGRETRSSETWELMQQWLDEKHAICTTNAVGGWAYVIAEPPGAYYASAAGSDCHYLQFKIIEGLKEAGFSWYELGQAHTEGIGTFKRGFGSVLID